MNVFKLFGTIALNGTDKFNSDIDSSTNKASQFASKLGNGLKTVAKVSAAAVTAAATGIAAITKSAIDNYAEYEQLIGGTELMFGEGFDFIAEKAKTAYKDVQMSQNDYLTQVNGFAVGLKTALGGNGEAAAELAAKIVTAEADIIAATGNSQEAVQNAFNGIMKSNFTMLDNLGLGITPTKEGFQEVIDKVNEWNAANGNATSYMMDNLADCQAALVDYVEMQGMAGYAANEAAGTIQGSLSMMKGAWQDLLTGLADESADHSALIANLVDSVGAVAENIMPKVEIVLQGIGGLIEKIAPIIIEKLPVLINTLLPSVVSAATNLIQSIATQLPSLITTLLPTLVTVALSVVQSFVTAISENGSLLIQCAVDAIVTLTDGILSMLPEIIKLGLDLIVSLATGIANSLPKLIPSLVETIVMIAETLTSPDMLSQILDAALTLIINLAYGLMDAIPQLVDACIEIVINIVEFLIDPDNIAKLLNAALHLVIALGTGLINAIPQLMTANGRLIKSLIDTFKETDWGQVGKDLIDGLLDGLKSAWESIKKWFSNAWDSLFGGKEVEIDASVNENSSGVIHRTGHATGLDYVPYDNYPANLHKGEMVLPANQADYLRRGAMAQSNGEIVEVLMQILDAVQGVDMSGMSLNINNREFARMVKAVN